MADYCTIAEAKASAADVAWGATYDTILTSLVTAASRAIDRATKRMPNAFAAVAGQVRYFDGSGNKELDVDELAAAPTKVEVAEAGFTVSWTEWAATDFVLWPYNALLEGMPYTRLIIDAYNGTKTLWYRYLRNVRITGPFGYSSAAPETIKEACIIQTIRWFKRGEQMFRDTGAIIELGQLTYTQALDPDVALLLDLYTKKVI